MCLHRPRSLKMKQKSRSVFRIGAALVWMSLAACGPRTKISYEWSDPAVKPAPLTKVVAIAMSKDRIMRRIAEDEFLDRMPKQTIGVAGYALISDSDREDVEKVRAILEGAKVDGAAVFRLVGADREIQYNRGTVYANFWGYYGWVMPIVFDPGYVLTEQVVRVESLLYSVESGELLWSGVSETTNPNSARTVVDDVVRGVVRRMKAMGYLK